MDAKLFEQLLYEEESPSLDFKRDQYLFVQATDEEKSELLKDVLSFANAWRREDAYILIGVQEVKGGKSNVVGLVDHIDDANLQQFVNSKVNKPINFSYEAFMFEGKQVGIIKISIQERPFFLLRNYGKLEKEKVYIRRGSSSEIAKPDEIANMGANAIASKQLPILDLQFGNNKSRSVLGRNLSLTSEFLLLPEKSDIPKNDGDNHSFIAGLWSTNENYYKEFAEYKFMASLLKPISLVIINTGTTLVTNVQIQIVQTKIDDFLILNESAYPDKPDYSIGVAVPGFASIDNSIASHISTDVDDFDDKWEVSLKMGNIQPGAKSWSDIFYVAAFEDKNIKFDAIVYADNLPIPMQIELELSLKIEERSISLDELITMADIDRNV